MNIKKREIVKAAVGLAVGAGVGIIAANAVRSFVPEDINKFQRVLVAVGGGVLVAAVSEVAVGHVDNLIDTFMGGVDKSIQRRHNEEIVAGAEDLLKDSGDSALE